MQKVKQGDEVIVITGKDKGKKGKVLYFVKSGQKLIVEGINVVRKHTKGNPNANQPGAIVDKSMPIHRSNVMIYDAAQSKGSRVGIKLLNDNKKVRYFKTSDQLIDTDK